MKAIPKNEFIELLDIICSTDDSVVSERTCEYLLTLYGDTYYCEYGGDFELCEENSKRKTKLEEWRKMK